MIVLLDNNKDLIQQTTYAMKGKKGEMTFTLSLCLFFLWMSQVTKD